MKKELVLLVCVASFVLGGCGWMGSIFSGPDKEVPITSPTESTPAEIVEQPKPEELVVVQAYEPASQPKVEPVVQTPPQPEQTTESIPTEPVKLTDLVSSELSDQPQEPDQVVRLKLEPPTTQDVPTAPEPEVVEQPKENKSEVIASSLLQVNGSYITPQTVLHGARDELKALPENISELTFKRQAAEIIQTHIQNIVARELVLAEAQNRLGDRQNQYIDYEVDEFERKMLAKAGGSRTVLKYDLSKRGTTLEEVLEAERKALTIQVYMRSRFSPAITVNRRMLWNYYRRNLSEFSKTQKVQMQLIAAPYKSFLPHGIARPSKAELQVAREKADEEITNARQALQGGEDFGEVAKKISRGIKAASGGVWPMMQKGSFRESAVEEKAFEMTESDVSDIIETDKGYYIVKVKAVQAGEVVSFEDAQEEIEEKLREQQYRKLSNEYFGQILQKATIIRPQKFIELTLEQTVDEYWKK